eukprot:TRINITY_DN11926_c0_g1_i1.p1 TRINITY_DN11926_c0_g1~~TRINITY_DN11926_c0_g1_i1.p1  ORF type:complete len:474 (-),score=92.52 TRINITY_DN11926_c0_g1_i1:110-1531(-)
MQFFQEMIETISNFQFLDTPKEIPPAHYCHVFPTSMLAEGTSQGHVSCAGSLIQCLNDTPKEYWTARANCPIRVTSFTSFYFEITLESLQDGVVALGLCTRDFPTSRAVPGWLDRSYGYHSDDGGIFASSGEKAKMGWQKFGAGDVVGCGIEGGKVYFTRNKAKLETSIKLPQDLFYITVGMSRKSSWSYNFGAVPFVGSLLSADEFKQPSLAQVNHSHPLLSIPHCIWPALVPFCKGTKLRHGCWQALLSACKALQEYLLPLFSVLSCSDYYDAISGYYFSGGWVTDVFVEIHRNKVTVIKKIGNETDKPNDIEKKTALCRLEREVVGVDQQKIELTSTELGDWKEPFYFERYQPVLLKQNKCTKEEYESLLKEHKRIKYPSLCGAAVVTPGTPCCHDAISGMVLEVFQRIPRESEGYNEMMLGMSEVVENLAQECMRNAMTRQEIHRRIIENVLEIAPHLTGTLLNSGEIW